MWLPRFACSCGRPFPVSGCGAGPPCTTCGGTIRRELGIYRALAPDRRSRLQPFLQQYRRVRERDGYRVPFGAYYRALPTVALGDPQAAIWRIRRRSFDRLCRQVLPCMGASPAVLDLGAGCAWLSHQLARRGCRPVAVDLLTDERDGLGAARHYDVAFARVQADFDVLPLMPGQFDLVVFNGSLHYAPDVSATLERTAAMLAPRGRLVVIDSPMFERDRYGAAMRARLTDRLCRQYGIVEPVEPGEGFLTFGRLDRWAAGHGLSSTFLPTHDGWTRRLQRTAALLGRSAPPARFGLWVAA